MSADASKVRDVVCGMMIDPRKAGATRTVEGVTFYFCSAGCAKQFDADPHRFAQKQATEHGR